MCRIDIVIVNWNSGIYLEKCIESIIKSNNSGLVCQVIVVDNNSHDNSLCFINKYNDNKIFSLVLIRNQSNIGFAAACNKGFCATNSDYVLFLNPDCLINAKALSLTSDFIDNNDVGVVGIKQYSDKALTSRSCARFPTVIGMILDAIGLTKLNVLKKYSHHMTDWDHESSAYVDHVIGSYYLVKSKLFRLLNGFDERFFVYLEDLDFSFRVKRNGHQIYYLASASIYHAGGGCSQNVKDVRTYLALKSKFIYCKKHFSQMEFKALMIVFISLEPAARIINAGIKEGCSGVSNTIKAYQMLLRDYFE